MRNLEDVVKSNLLVEHRAGSHAYGTNVKSSDIDIRGLFVADRICISTPFFPVYEFVVTDQEDTKYYELCKFMKLVLECNPNIIETLWVDESDVLKTSDAYKLLRSNRSRLLSAKAAFTFSGYAFSQLKRIQGHNKWISNPQPERRPQQIDFVKVLIKYPESLVRGLGFHDLDTKFVRVHQHTLMFGYQVNSRCITDSGELIINDDEQEKFFIPLALVGYDHEAYMSAVSKWQQYWEWKNNRNEIRSELEELFGYDTKHAMHLVRLLRMGYEILTTGEVLIKRPDAEELLSIRKGSWSYNQIIEYASDMEEKVKEVYNSTSLRKAPDIKTAADLVIKIQDMYWYSSESDR